MTEIELCKHVENHFSDRFDIYKEMNVAGRCDLVLKNGSMVICIEAKLQFNVKVITQALRHLPYSNYCYVAVPEKLRNSTYEAREICRLLGIGVLIVRLNGRCDVNTEPKYNRRTGKIRFHEKHKDSIAGSQHDYQSDFKISLREIEAILTKKGGSIKVKELFEKESRFHWSSTSSARQCFTRYVNTGVLPQFAIQKGILSFTAK